MVFLRVAIRLEVAPGAPLPPWEKDDYPGMAVQETEQAEPEVETVLPEGDDHARDRNCKARGRRTCNSISIETFEQISEHPGDSNSDCVQVPFFYGNSSIENTEGILHIYKPRESMEEGDNTTLVPSRIMCMLGVPPSMTSQNVLEFLSPFSDNILHIRFLRDSAPDAYMVLLKFRDQASAMECHSFINGRQYNSIEKNVCNLAFVYKVEVIKSNEGGSLPMADHVEMPKCTVCFERLDENVLGLLTIPCNHSFHASCMKRWSDSTCPVCRHLITPGFNESQTCPVCGKHDDLWICLICGHVGCGRYANGHAHQHFQETQHTFALELGGHRVWDYAGDNYVHRLVQTKSDGKMVEINRGDGHVDDSEKVEALNLEYSYLLSREMDSQRQYFEEIIHELRRDTCSKIDNLQNQVNALKQECVTVRDELDKATVDKRQLQHKLSLTKAKLEKMEVLYGEELQLNSSLRKNQIDYQGKVQELEAQVASLTKAREEEVAALKEEVRDLMIHIESAARLAVENVGDEIRESRLFVPNATATASNRRPTRRRENRHPN